jgi:hypothetical protein
MCMLTYLPPDVMPDAKALTNGTINNQDGHGYAIVIPGRKPRLIVRHSLNAQELIERFIDERTKYPHGPALFHSRYGTSGNYGKFNCHPFYVAGDKRTVVAHNGVLPQSMQPTKKDKRCDTRKFAEESLTRDFGDLNDVASRDLVAEAITTYNKLVILTIDPAYNSYVYLINEASGIWNDDGIWYSNFDFQGYDTKSSRFSWLFDDHDDDDWEAEDCPFCKSKSSVDVEYQICNMCLTCMDCLDHIDDCMCVYPNTGTDYEEQEMEWIS